MAQRCHWRLKFFVFGIFKVTFTLRLISVVVIRWWQQIQVNYAQNKKEFFLHYLHFVKRWRKLSYQLFQAAFSCLGKDSVTWLLINQEGITIGLDPWRSTLAAFWKLREMLIPGCYLQRSWDAAWGSEGFKNSSGDSNVQLSINLDQTFRAGGGEGVGNGKWIIDHHTHWIVLYFHGRFKKMYVHV